MHDRIYGKVFHRCSFESNKNIMTVCGCIIGINISMFVTELHYVFCRLIVRCGLFEVIILLLFYKLISVAIFLHKRYNLHGKQIF